jgi:hypothetical protein
MHTLEFHAGPFPRTSSARLWLLRSGPAFRRMHSLKDGVKRNRQREDQTDRTWQISLSPINTTRVAC